MEPEETPRERAGDLIRLLIPDWRPTPQQALWAIRLALVLGVLVAIGYAYDITLWDWMKLLIVPAVIAIGGLWFNHQQQERQREDERRQRERELEVENQRAQDVALQAYLDQMSKLLADTERPLHEAKPGDSLSTVARAWTLTVLSRLGRDRKRSVAQFLFESGLIKKNTLVIQLHGADLRGVDLRGAIPRHATLREAAWSNATLSEVVLSWSHMNGSNLSGQDLRGADLQGAGLLRADLSETDLSGANLRNAHGFYANLRGSNLSRSNLSGSTFSGSDLSGTDLSKAVPRYANLSRADLRGSNLSGADLHGTILQGADLSRASGITNEELSRQTSRLEGATMPDGQKYEDWRKDREGHKLDGGNSGSS